MQLDWITVVAQIINFLVLVWLLHRFLYGPITSAMERREERIKSRLAEAKEQKEKAEASQRELDEKIDALEQERKDRLEKAYNEAEELKRLLEQEAREEVDRKREAWIAEMIEDREEFLAGLREKVAREFHLLAEDALATLADTSLSDRMAEAFLESLRDMEDEDRQRMAGAARREGFVEIEAGRELDAGLRRRVTRAIHELIAADVEVGYSSDAEGLVGIRMRAGSATVEWSVAEYLDRFNERLQEAFPNRPGESASQTGEGDGNLTNERRPKAADAKRPARSSHE